MASAASAAFITYLKEHRNIVDYLWITSSAVLVYDYLLCLGHEIKYIWLSDWSYATALFAIVRYLPIMLIYFNLQFQILLDNPLSLCKHISPLIHAAYLITVFIAETILMIRVWAIWNRSTYIGVVLICLQIASLILSATGNARSIAAAKIVEAPYPGFRGCFFARAKNTLSPDFVGVIVYQVVVLGLVLYSAYRAYNLGNMSRFSRLVHRDGIIFYVYLLAATIVNLVLLEAYSLDVGSGFIPLWGNLYSIFTCRVMLRIRHGSRNFDKNATTLHYFENEEILNDIEFAGMTRMETITAANGGADIVVGGGGDSANRSDS